MHKKKLKKNKKNKTQTQLVKCQSKVQTHTKRKQKKETCLKFLSFHFSRAWFVKDVERERGNKKFKENTKIYFTLFLIGK